VGNSKGLRRPWLESSPTQKSGSGERRAAKLATWAQGLNNDGQAERLASSKRYDGGRALPRLLSNLLLCGPMIATHGKTKLEQQRFPTSIRTNPLLV
jgi:hypothetical protein